MNDEMMVRDMSAALLAVESIRAAPQTTDGDAAANTERLKKVAQKAVTDTAELYWTLEDYLEVCKLNREAGNLNVSLAKLKMAVTYALAANKAATNCDVATCQLNCDQATAYYNLFAQAKAVVDGTKDGRKAARSE